MSTTSSTAQVDYNSDIVRKRWISEGLLQAASKSFWTPFTGMSKDAIVYQMNNETASEGHTVVFDFEGNITGRAVRGKDTAYGTGEDKRIFSDKLTVERYRWSVYNGDKFDGVNIGNLSITEHQDSRSKLGDLFVRVKDQILFDSAQGNLITNEDGLQRPSHTIDLGADFTFNNLLDIERTLKTSQGYTTGGIRRPLEPYMMETMKYGEQPCWVFLVDSHMANLLRKDVPGYQTIVRSGDVRGNNNRNIRGIIGKLGSLLIVEAGQFFGSNHVTSTGWKINDFSVEMQGLRQYDGADPSTALWTGQEGFDYSSANLHSRGLILGKGALQLAFGKMPDYKFQSSIDYGIDSESCLEVWLEARKTNLKQENGDYAAAKVADLDYGVIAVDVAVA